MIDMSPWKKFLKDFNTPPNAVKPLGVPRSSKVTQVISREESSKAFSAGVERIRAQQR
jgi:hypothetical protein